MKVLLLCGASLDSGCWLKTQYLGKSLEKAGNEVSYITPVKSKPFMLDYILSLCKYTFISFFKKCDVIVGIKAYPNVTFPMLLKKAGGALTVLDLDDLDYAYRDGFISSLSKFVQTPFPKMFDLVTYHNDNLRNHAMSDFKVREERLFRLDQGVDFDVFNNSLVADKKELFSRYNISKPRIIVYTAHLNIASDLDAILDAFALVSEKVEDVELVVAGGGPMLEDFKVLAEKKGIGKRVVFTGYIKNQEVARLSKIADLCVVFYKNKKANLFRTSMKIRENLAMGKDVVCNDIGDLKEFKDYTYQTSTDVSDFASGIVGALEGGVDDRSSKAVDYIVSKYSWKDIGSRFSSKLKGLV